MCDAALREAENRLGRWSYEFGNLLYVRLEIAAESSVLAGVSYLHSVEICIDGEDWESARPLLGLANEALESSVGIDHRWTIKCGLLRVGMAIRDGKLEEAEDALLALEKKVNDNLLGDDPIRAMLFERRGELAWERGERNLAAREFDEGLEFLRSSIGQHAKDYVELARRVEERRSRLTKAPAKNLSQPKSPL